MGSYSTTALWKRSTRDTLELLGASIQNVIFIQQLCEDIHVRRTMLHITEEMGMSTEHIGGLQGIQNLAQRRHRMVGFATEAKPRMTSACVKKLLAAGSLLSVADASEYRGS
jgi:hypothetical protein